MTLEPSPRYLAVAMLAAEPSWLALTREERGRWAEIIGDICDRHPRVSVEWFDADGLSGRHSDFATFRFDELEAYQFVWDALRDTALFTKPYWRIVDVVLGRLQGYKAYEASLG